MSWDRPTLKTLNERIAKDFSARLLDGGPVLSRSVIAVLAKVWAGACHLMYGVLAWLYRQIFVDTAENEYLERWARVWSISRKLATSASGTVSITGANGSVIPSGTLLINNTTSLQYSLNSDVTIGSAGTVDATVTSVTAAADSNVDAGILLSLVSPIAGVDSSVTVGSDGLTGGTDDETDDSLRERLLERIRNPPRGGSKADYIRWAKSISGVTRAWCYPMEQGIGTVGVTFVCDDATDIIPSSEIISRVKTYIDSVRPATVKEVYVYAPQILTVNITVKLNPNTVALQTAVQAELTDLFSSESQPGATIYLSHINEAISLASGEIDHTITAPTADIIADDGVMPVLGIVTFSA